MKVKDIDKANRLNRKDKQDLRTLLRLCWSPKSRSSYTQAEIKAENKALYFMKLGVI